MADVFVSYARSDRDLVAKLAAALEAVYARRDPTLIVDRRRLLPEDWPDDPAIRAALDKPDALYDIRRKNLAAHPRAKAK
jgi:hypothetical protein